MGLGGFSSLRAEAEIDQGERRNEDSRIGDTGPLDVITEFPQLDVFFFLKRINIMKSHYISFTYSIAIWTSGAWQCQFALGLLTLGIANTTALLYGCRYHSLFSIVLLIPFLYRKQ